MFKALIDLGLEKQPPTQASKIRITNLVSLITAVIAFGYALFFNFQLNQPAVMLMNFGFVVGYLLVLLLSFKKRFTKAKLWFFTTLNVHVFVLATVIFSPSSYFHLYYLIVPTGIFVLFEEEDTKEKFIIMLMAVVMFFAAVNYSPKPLIELSAKAEELILVSIVTVIMIEVYIVMTWFSKLMHVYQTKLVNMATKDPLTGIDNRRTFITDADEMMAHSTRYHTKLSLVIMDVDYFKKINDQAGHLVGDKVLKQVAKLIESHTRASDHFARYGGEEFVLLLPETSLQQALEMSENLRKTIEQHRFELEINRIKVTMSFGVTEKFDSDTEINELIKRADTALYQAKAAGRNKVISA